MHPLLARRESLGLYLIAWTPLAGVLILLLRASGSLSWLDAAALTIPSIALYAFLCLSAWYLCQSVPWNASRLLWIVLQYLTAALLCGVLWVALVKAWAIALSGIPRLATLDQRVDSALPVLLATGVLLYLLSLAVHQILMVLERSRRLEATEMQARILARDSELKALRAQLDPHFLFNSLNSISALTSIDPGKAREMCVLLSDFLRSTTGMGERSVIRFAEELDLARVFLRIEQVRFGSRLRLNEEIGDDCGACLLPPLLLQPLLENAIVHGIANMVEGGAILLQSRCSAGVLEIAVENIFDPNTPLRRSRGIGLENVRRRLELRFGPRAGLSSRAQGNHYRVEMFMPVEK